MSKNKVQNLQQFQHRSEELRSAGYVAVRPGRFAHSDGTKPTSWGEYIRRQIYAAESRQQSSSSKTSVSTLFASSGGENKGVPETIGTNGLGFMEWGIGNALPNTITLLSEMSPFVIAGWDFIKKMLVGRGPKPMYAYAQYVGGNITQKSIPFKDAGVLLMGQIRQLRQQSSPATGFLAEEGVGMKNDFADEELNMLEEAYRVWHDTWYGNEEKGIHSLRAFLEDNNLHQTYLEMAGDMAMMNQCFAEVQLAQGKATPTALWKPYVTGIKHRSNFTTRLERMDKHYKINYAYMSNRWLDTAYQTADSLLQDDITAIPFLGMNNETGEIEQHVRTARQNRVARKQRPTRFMMTCRDTTTGRPYYAESPWHSIFAGDIFEYATTIVSDRLTRKHNSNIIGRVIYIHQDYLNALFRQQTEGDKKRSMAQIQSEVFNDINTWLSNPDNAGQALISSVFTGPDGKEHKAWEIVEIESKANSQAQAEKTELQEITSIIFFAMGLDSKLIGNTPGDATSSGGTDLRERYLVKGIQFAPLQQLMLRPLEVASRYNHWDEHLQWEIEREVLTTLDNSKTGITRSTTRND